MTEPRCEVDFPSMAAFRRDLERVAAASRGDGEINKEAARGHGFSMVFALAVGGSHLISLPRQPGHIDGMQEPRERLARSDQRRANVNNRTVRGRYPGSTAKEFLPPHAALIAAVANLGRTAASPALGSNPSLRRLSCSSLLRLPQRI